MTQKKMLDKAMVVSAMLYLIIPIIMFLFGWFKLYISIPCILMLLCGGYLCIKEGLEDANIENGPFSFYHWTVAIVLLVCMVMLSGIGGFYHQNDDFHARNAIFHDLISHSWPVQFDYSQADGKLFELFGQKGFLNYYLASWLPAALVGKFFGWQAANIMLFVWVLLGVLLAFYFFIRKLGKISTAAILIFVFWSGADYIGHLYYRMDPQKILPFISRITSTHMEFWADRIQYSSFITQLFWVFNQAVPAWLITYFILSQKNSRSVLFLAALLLPFGPLPFIGAVLLAGYVVLFGKDAMQLKTNHPFQIKELFRNIQAMVTPANLGCIWFTLPFVLMFSASGGGQPKGFYFTRFMPHDTKEIWFFIIRLAVFYLLEFGLIAFIIRKYCNRSLVYYASAILLLLPMYTFGEYNDFVMRVSIPLLCVLCILTAEAFHNLKELRQSGWHEQMSSHCYPQPQIDELHARENKKSVRRATILIMVLVCILSVGALTPIAEMKRDMDESRGLLSNDNYCDGWKTFETIDSTPANIKEPYISIYVVPYEKKDILKYIIK